MKKSTYTKLFAMVAMSLTALGAWAVKPEAGKVYRIANQGYAKVMADQGPTASVGCSAQNSKNKSQLWLAETNDTQGTLSFRSLGTGMYLRSSNAQSTPWTITSSKAAKNTHMNIGTSGGKYTIASANSVGTHIYAHCDGSSIVVCWSTDAQPTLWDFDEVSMTQAEIDAALEATKEALGEQANESKYQALLDKIFTDKACTTLNSTYAGKTADQIKADDTFKALPAGLQAAVLKVKSGDWAETDPVNAEITWDSDRAKKFRVQLYEPYGSGQHVADLAGIQAYTNMNNPTGILSDNGSVLFVMVDKAPKDGSSLFLCPAAGAGMYNNPYEGTELHEGLNVVPGYTDCAHNFLFYTVETTGERVNGRLQPKNKVTDYEPIKIHIEGGSINGYFDYTGDELYKADTHEDYKYYADRARHEMFDLKGRYVICHFHLFDTKAQDSDAKPSWCLKSSLDPNINTGNGQCYDLVEIMRCWDRICLSERLMMGLQSPDSIKSANKQFEDLFETIEGDTEMIAGFKAAPTYSYSDYFNNRMLGISMPGSLYMNATSWRTAYNVNTITAITAGLPYNAGADWGPAHEYGHMNQAPVKVAGTTEISNNCFSNVAVYFRNEKTARADWPKYQVDVFNAGKTYLENGTWGTTRMYYQLFLYYHAAGHNKKFYPRLYELLRNHPLQKSYYLNNRYDALHFVKMCCVAAQEDLTDYFESWGFFVPLKNYHIGDYSNFMASLSQEDIDAVKAEIKAFGFPENKQIIFIDDRPGSKKISWADYMSIEQAGALGGLEHFRAGVTASGKMGFTLEDGKINVTLEDGASAGVGFLLYDQDGTLLGFSNDYTFPVSSKAIAAIMAGTATLSAVSADGKTVEVENQFLTASGEARLAELNKLVDSFAPVLGKVDPEGLRAGFYMPFYITDLQKAIDDAKALTASATAEEIAKAYTALLDANAALGERSNATIPLIHGSQYNIVHNHFPTRGLAVKYNKSKDTYYASNKASIAKNYDNEACIWTLEFHSYDGADQSPRFKLKNKETGLYLAAADDQNKTAEIPMVKSSSAGIWTIKQGNQGEWTLCSDGNWKLALQISGGAETGTIGVWGGDDVNGKWQLRLNSASKKGGNQAALRQLIADSRELLPQGGSINIVGDAINLTADQITTNAKFIQEGHADNFTSFDVLLDVNTDTYFHSNWANGGASTDGKDHRLDFDLGEGNSTSSFTIGWTNRNGTPEQAITAATVYGSNDGSKYTKLASLSGMTTTQNESYVSPVISDGNAYRYIRMEVNQSTGGKFFCISEISLNNGQYEIVVAPEYPNVTEELLLALDAEINNAQGVLDNDASTSTKLSNAYTSLRAAYEALAAAMGVEAAPELNVPGLESSIVEIGTAPAVQGIYDLQGRRVNKAGKGIYIINGEKQLVK